MADYNLILDCNVLIVIIIIIITTLFFFNHHFLFIFADLVEFTDEEGYGKYLDLHEVYDKFLNLRGIEVRIRLIKL